MKIIRILTRAQPSWQQPVNDLIIPTAAFLPGQEGKGQLVPAEWTRSAVAAIKFDCPDMTPALDVKEYYSQLAESLQVRHHVT